MPTDETMIETLTDETPPPADAAKNAAKTPNWAQRRIDQLTAEKHDAKNKADALQAQLDAITQTHAAPQDVERMALELAAQKDFETRCNRVHKDGSAAYKDFDTYVEAIGTQGGLSPVVVDAIIASDDAVPLIVHLGTHPELVAAIKRMPPHLQIAELVRLERKIEQQTQQEPTAAPDPIQPLHGAAASAAAPSDTDDVRTWVRKRNAEVRRK